jgi:hypothetical protein
LSRLLGLVGVLGTCFALLASFEAASAEPTVARQASQAGVRTYAFVGLKRVGYVEGDNGGWSLSWSPDDVIVREEHDWLFYYWESWRKDHRAGYAKPLRAGLWVVREPPTLLGYLKRSSATRWEILDRMSRPIGHTQGRDGIAAGTAVLFKGR